MRRGLTQREVAQAVGRSERTVRLWLREVEGFREAASAAGAVEEVSPVETLQTALEARRADGSPDWRIRVTAAKALLASGFVPPPVVSVPPGGMVVYPEALAELLEESE